MRIVTLALAGGICFILGAAGANAQTAAASDLRQPAGIVQASYASGNDAI